MRIPNEKNVYFTKETRCHNAESLWQLICQLEEKKSSWVTKSLRGCVVPISLSSVLLRLRLLGQLIPILFKKKYFSSGFLDRGTHAKTIHIKMTLGRSKCWRWSLMALKLILLSRKFLWLPLRKEKMEYTNKAWGQGRVFPSSEFSAWWNIMKVYNHVGNWGRNILNYTSVVFGKQLRWCHRKEEENRFHGW